MISEDNKLARTNKTGYIPIVKKEPKKEERKPGMFHYADYDDDFFCSDNKMKVDKSELVITIRENI